MSEPRPKRPLPPKKKVKIVPPQPEGHRPLFAMGKLKDPPEGFRLPGLADDRPKIQLPGNDRLLSDFATELAEILKDKALLYQRGGLAVTVNQQKIEVVSSQLLRTLVEKHVVCYRLSISAKGNEVNFDRTMTESDASGVLESRQFIEPLPQIDKIATARLPVIRADGKLELLPKGYDAESKTLTIDPCEFDESVSLAQAKKVIDDLYGEFVFAKDGGRSKAVAIAAMVGQFADGLIARGAPRPVFSYLANAEGAGKTFCAKCALSPTHGAVPINVGIKNDEEVEKRLLTAVIEGRGFILFDNCKGRIDSPALEAFVSASQFRGRILGISKSFEGPNDTSIVMTGNGCTFSPDLRRRSLVIQLVMREEFAEDRKFKRMMDDAELLKRRPMILAALWALVKAWDAAGRPKPSREHSSFPRWAEIVGGVVEHAGYGCPLQRAEIEGMVDTDSSDMRRLVETLWEDQEQAIKGYTFDAVVDTCGKIGAFEGLMNEVDQTGQLKPGARTTFGYVLKRYHERIFGEESLTFIIAGQGHARRFKVAKQS